MVLGDKTEPAETSLRCIFELLLCVPGSRLVQRALTMRLIWAAQNWNRLSTSFDRFLICSGPQPKDQAENCSGRDQGDAAENKGSSDLVWMQAGAVASSADFMCGSGPICAVPGFAC